MSVRQARPMRTIRFRLIPLLVAAAVLVTLPIALYSCGNRPLTKAERFKVIAEEESFPPILLGCLEGTPDGIRDNLCIVMTVGGYCAVLDSYPSRQMECWN